MVSFRSNLAAIVVLLFGAFVFQATAESKDELLNKFLESQKKVQTWSADLIQTRTSKSFAKPLTAPGRVWFAAPNRFHWELGTPAKTIAVRNVDQMLVIYPKLKRVEKYPLNSDAPAQWKDMLALLDAGFPQSRTELEERFKILTVNTTGNTAEIVLEPKSATARKMMPQFKLGFNLDGFALVSTEMQFADGSTMRNDFSNAKVNADVDEKLFNPEISADYKVVEPLKK